MTRTVPIDNDDIRLRVLFGYLTQGDVVQLTQEGRLAAVVVVDRQSYEQLRGRRAGRTSRAERDRG